MPQPSRRNEIMFDAFTICSFLPNLDSARAIPLVIIGYRAHEDPYFIWLVPSGGVNPVGITDDPYYVKVLRDPHAYFTRKLEKYAQETGSVKRGIEMIIDCHQNHLAFTPLMNLDEMPLRHPLVLDLVHAF